MSAFGCKADMGRRTVKIISPLLTRSGHERAAFAAVHPRTSAHDPWCWEAHEDGASSSRPFMRRGDRIASDQNQEHKHVRDEKQRHDESWNEVRGLQHTRY